LKHRGVQQQFDIVHAAPEHLDALLPLVAAYRAFYEQSPDEQRERRTIESHLRNGTSTIFLAVEREGARRAVGFMQLFQTFSTVWLGPALILEDLFVLPDVRRGGIATALLQRAVAFAREIGATGMFLETAMNNAPAQAVYERAGWIREGRFYKYNATL
jgi:GNAT superfamily N-acetyltransferase